MYKLLRVLLLAGPGLAVPSLFAGTHARVPVAPPRADARDQAYCQAYLGAPDPLAEDRFADLDPLEHVLPRLVELTHRNERTNRSLSQAERVRLMADVNLADIIGYVREHLDGAMPLDQVYRAYLDAAWLKLAHYARTQNTQFFADESDVVPTTRNEFVRARMAAFAEKFPKPADVGPVLSRLAHWLPRGPGDQFRALAHQVEVAPQQSILGDLLLGGDPIAALTAEVAREPRDDRNPSGIGALREHVFAEYADLDLLWKSLDKPKGKTLVDLNAGIGRVGLSLAAHGTGVRYIGFENVETRVREGERMAASLNLKASEWRLDHVRVTSPGFEPPPADFYYMSNDFYPSDLERVLEKLGERAREGRAFTVIMGYEPLFKEAAEEWPDELAHAAKVFPPLPSWLHFKKAVHVEGPNYHVSFYILEARRR